MSEPTSSSLHPFITQRLVDSKKFYCPFFEKGQCRHNDKCNFSHDISDSIKIPEDYCHFYLANQCLYGAYCKFRHCEPIAAEDDIIQQLMNSHINDNNNSQQQQLHDINANIDASEANNINITPTTSQSINLADLQINISYTSPSSSSTPVSASYANICKGPDGCDKPIIDPRKLLPLCPYSSLTGISCPFPNGQCSYIHGLDCDLCGRLCLHPYDPEQQREHRDECLREHEREMELSFAIQRSKDKVCGVCMDVVVEKKPITSSRFGILEKCNHVFCLDCIRKWRGTKQFETRTIRACPECRVSSDFVVPSKYWIEDQDDKDKLIHDYKGALKSKPCKYFNEGKGECPFAGSCFYKHAYPDGSLARPETPKPRRRVTGNRGIRTTMTNFYWQLMTSADEDNLTNDDIESLYQIEQDYGITDDDDELPSEFLVELESGIRIDYND